VKDDAHATSAENFQDAVRSESAEFAGLLSRGKQSDWEPIGPVLDECALRRWSAFEPRSRHGFADPTHDGPSMRIGIGHGSPIAHGMLLADEAIIVGQRFGLAETLLADGQMTFDGLGLVSAETTNEKLAEIASRDRNEGVRG
jgi:hypothetical protein